MAELLETIRSRLDDSTLEGLSRSVGSDPSSVRNVVSMALPMMIAGLSKNVHDSPEGRSSLNRALESDHDGSLLDRFGSLLGGSAGGTDGGLSGLAGAVGGLLGGGEGAKGATNGDGILRHLLGGRRGALEEGAARASGMDRSQVGRLLTMLAPLVMSALGKVKRDRGLSEDGVAEVVESERRDLERATPDAGEGDLRRLLDDASDDEVSSLVGRLGSALGGSFLSSGRG